MTSFFCQSEGHRSEGKIDLGGHISEGKIEWEAIPKDTDLRGKRTHDSYVFAAKRRKGISKDLNPDSFWIDMPFLIQIGEPRKFLSLYFYGAESKLGPIVFFYYQVNDTGSWEPLIFFLQSLILLQYARFCAQDQE
jgi:hypothetical protein